MDRGNDPAKKRPGGRKKTQEHPVDRRGSSGRDEPNADERLIAEELSDGQGQALCGRVFAHVGGADQNVRCFKMLGKRRSRVGQASMSEGVGGEEIAEFILHARLRDAVVQCDGTIGDQRQRGGKCGAEKMTARKGVEHGGDAVEHVATILDFRRAVTPRKTRTLNAGLISPCGRRILPGRLCRP